MESHHHHHHLKEERKIRKDCLRVRRKERNVMSTKAYSDNTRKEKNLFLCNHRLIIIPAISFIALNPKHEDAKRGDIRGA
jgi:hypothetical protein